LRFTGDAPVSTSKTGEVSRGIFSELGIRIDVAIKRPLLDSTDPGRRAATRRLIENETAVLNALKDLPPNEARYFPKLVESGPDFLATEWLQGRTLWDLSQSGQLGPAEATRILGEARKAIEILHNRGFVHGDVKPNNIFVTDDGSVKLIDLGLTVREGTWHLSAGTSGYAHEDQEAGKPARFDHDRRGFERVEAEVKRATRPSPSSPESYATLAGVLGVNLEKFGKGANFDWRQFYREVSVRSLVADVPPDQLSLLKRLHQEHGKMVSPEVSLDRVIPHYEKHAADPARVPLPTDYSSHPGFNDRGPIATRRETLGRISWRNGDEKFTSMVAIYDSVGVKELLTYSNQLHPSFVKHLQGLSENATIKTVRTRIASQSDSTYAKFEFHLIETPDGKRTLVFDKAFTDINDRHKPVFSAEMSNGQFGALQAARALLGDGGFDQVQYWEVVNFDTVMAIHQAEQSGIDAPTARKRPVDLVARSTDRFLSKMGFERAGDTTITGGEYRPFGRMAYTGSGGSGGGSDFMDPVPYSGPTITYSFTADSKNRRARNREELEAYKKANPGITDQTEAFAAFDLSFPVRARTATPPARPAPRRVPVGAN